MPRTKDADDLIRVHVMVSKEDWLLWNSMFGKNMGTSKALRLIMRDYLKRLERRVEEEKQSA